MLQAPGKRTPLRSISWYMLMLFIFVVVGVDSVGDSVGSICVVGVGCVVVVECVGAVVDSVGVVGVGSIGVGSVGVGCVWRPGSGDSQQFL